MRIELRAGGPHSDDYTTEVARAFSESVRVLNHATFTGRGLTNPQTVYEVAGALAGGAAGLRQLFDQMTRFLGTETAHGRLAHDNGADPAITVSGIGRQLGFAGLAAAELFEALSAVQNAASHLYVPDHGQED
jgi:hypothetical protein